MLYEYELRWSYPAEAKGACVQLNLSFSNSLQNTFYVIKPSQTKENKLVNAAHRREKRKISSIQNEK